MKKEGLTEPQKVILTTLRRNTGSFMKKTINHNGTEKYKIFNKELSPIAWANKADVIYLLGLGLFETLETGFIVLDHQAYNRFYKLKPKKNEQNRN